MSLELDDLIFANNYNEIIKQTKEYEETEEYKQNYILLRCQEVTKIIIDHFDGRTSNKKPCTIINISEIQIYIPDIIEIVEQKGYTCNISDNILYIYS